MQLGISMQKTGKMRLEKYWKTRYVIFLSISHSNSFIHTCQMEDYWSRQPRAQSTSPSTSTSMNTAPPRTSILSDYDQYRQSLMASEDDEGWAAELRYYLKDMPADVTKETDIVEWWQVSFVYLNEVFGLIQLTESCSPVSDTCADCSRRPPMPGVIRSM